MTRTEYLAPYETEGLEYRKEATQRHYDFYSQFVTESTKAHAKAIIQRILKNQIKEVESNLSFVELKIWDMNTSSLNFCVKTFKEMNNQTDKGTYSISLSEKVCILKCAAKMVLLENGYKKEMKKDQMGYWTEFLVKES